MTELGQGTRRSSSIFWIGFLIAILGFASNFLYWLSISQSVIPWINVAVPLIGLVVLLVGLLRFWPGANLWRKALGVFLGLLSAAALAISVWAFVDARNIPGAAGAPQVGQKVPDFTLPDSTGQSVSLAQLLSDPMTNSTRPKVVLLVFYRGYW